MIWHEWHWSPAWALALAALAGLAVGGCLTWVVYRLPVALRRGWRGGPPMTPPRPLRGERVRAVPLAGWWLARGGRIGLRARARRQGFGPGWALPLAELACAVLFALCVWRFGVTLAALAAMVLCAALLTLAWIDLRLGLLPDVLTLPLAWAGLLVNLGTGFATLPQAVLGAVAGYLFLWLVFHLFRLCTGRDGMGYGDFKLSAALGAWLGLADLPTILLLASLGGVLAGWGLRLAGRVGRGEPLPFAPFLASAGLAALFLQEHGAAAPGLLH
ncbi:prepilin peptidase [Bordetella genomosp. 1]|uniref:Prepilin type IV endopeptidase peptidase domain-containing protein n=1 Tax=Bordetella genomosp. 1 TaxID=1395607 RepID=A0ABX4F565_9BORD|nr:A24 family peptidase [Bordetella genomosp. 1]OZI68902.1 hypothetical protein CAL27_05445 [Bordetella genomosp. 1]